MSLSWDENHDLTTSYDGGYSYTQITPDYTKTPKIPLDMCWSPNGNLPELALGKYIITVYENGIPRLYVYRLSYI